VVQAVSLVPLQKCSKRNSSTGLKLSTELVSIAIMHVTHILEVPSSNVGWTLVVLTDFYVVLLSKPLLSNARTVPRFHHSSYRLIQYSLAADRTVK
jgi:hypothetical protein